MPSEYLRLMPKERILKVTIEIPDLDSETNNWKKLSISEFFNGLMTRTVFMILYN